MTLHGESTSIFSSSKLVVLGSDQTGVLPFVVFGLFTCHRTIFFAVPTFNLLVSRRSWEKENNGCTVPDDNSAMQCNTLVTGK
jgi:hypothetical protein